MCQGKVGLAGNSKMATHGGNNFAYYSFYGTLKIILKSQKFGAHTGLPIYILVLKYVASPYCRQKLQSDHWITQPLTDNFPVHWCINLEIL